MFGKDAEIGCEYVVPVAVGYYFSYDRLVNLYNSDRSTAVGVLVMNIDDYRSVLNLVVYNGRNAPLTATVRMLLIKINDADIAYTSVC